MKVIPGHRNHLLSSKTSLGLLTPETLDTNHTRGLTSIQEQIYSCRTRENPGDRYTVKMMTLTCTHTVLN